MNSQRIFRLVYFREPLGLFPQDAHMPRLKTDAKGGEVKSCRQNRLGTADPLILFGSFHNFPRNLRIGRDVALIAHHVLTKRLSKTEAYLLNDAYWFPLWPG